MTSGDRIKIIRKDHGKSLRRLAREADISVAYLSNIEKGESSPTVDVLRKIAHSFNMSVHELTEPVEGEQSFEMPASLKAFVAEYQGKFPELEDSDWQRALAHVRLRGRYPKDPDDWLPVFASMRQALGNNS